jgi:hypothetical protein
MTNPFKPLVHALTSDGGRPLLDELGDFASAEMWGSARLNAAHPLALFLRPWFPCVAVVLYLLSEGAFDGLRRGLKVRRDGVLFKLFILLHNFALAAFSLWVAVYTWPILFRHLSAPGGFKTLHCDRAVWSDEEHGIATWAVIFYVSKFYEFIDTWVLVLKNSDGKHAPSFLQKFHHFGIAIAMYCAVATESNWVIWCLCLNATIHTMMYTYYFFVTLGYRSSLAKVLTNLQMLQFLTGIVMSSCIYVYADCASATPASKASLLYIQVYAAYLIHLFREMAKKKYAAKKKQKEEAKAEKKA